MTNNLVLIALSLLFQLATAESESPNLPGCWNVAHEFVRNIDVARFCHLSLKTAKNAVGRYTINIFFGEPTIAFGTKCVLTFGYMKPRPVPA